MPPRKQQQWAVFSARLSPDGGHVLCEVEPSGGSLGAANVRHVVLYPVADDGTIDGATPVLMLHNCDGDHVFWHRTGASCELLRYVEENESGEPRKVVRCADGGVAITLAAPPPTVAAHLKYSDFCTDDRGDHAMLGSAAGYVVWDIATGSVLDAQLLNDVVGRPGDYYCTLSPAGRRVCVRWDKDVTIVPVGGRVVASRSGRTAVARLHALQHTLLFNADESIAVALPTPGYDAAIVCLDTGAEAQLQLPLAPQDWLQGSLCFVPGHPDRMCVAARQGAIATLEVPPRDDPGWEYHCVAPSVLLFKPVQLPRSWMAIAPGGRDGSDNEVDDDAPRCTWRWGRTPSAHIAEAATTMVLWHGASALVTNGELESVDVVPLQDAVVNVAHAAVLLGPELDSALELELAALREFTVMPLPPSPQRVLAPLVEPAVLPAEVLETHVATWLTPLSFGGVAQPAAQAGKPRIGAKRERRA